MDTKPGGTGVIADPLQLEMTSTGNTGAGSIHRRIQCQGEQLGVGAKVDRLRPRLGRQLFTLQGKVAINRQ